MLVSAPPVRAGTLIARNTAAAGRGLTEAATAASLSELRLPDTVFDLLQPMIQAAGWTLEHQALDDPYSEAPLRLTVARRGDERRYLLHFDSEDGSSPLEAFTRQSKRLVSEVWERLSAHTGRGGSIHVVFRVKPHPAFDLLMNKRWNEVYGLSTRRIDLGDVDQLLATPALLQEQLADWLDLGETGEAPSASRATPHKRPAHEMQRFELGRLAKILSELPSFLTSGDRNALLDTAGLAALAPKFQLEGAATEVARDLVYFLENGELGQLIEALTAQDLRPADADFVASLLARFTFQPE